MFKNKINKKNLNIVLPQSKRSQMIIKCYKKLKNMDNIGKYVELSNIMLIFSESTCLMKTFQKEMNVKVS